MNVWLLWGRDRFGDLEVIKLFASEEEGKTWLSTNWHDDRDPYFQLEQRTVAGGQLEQAYTRLVEKYLAAASVYDLPRTRFYAQACAALEGEDPSLASIWESLVGGPPATHPYNASTNDSDDIRGKVVYEDASFTVTLERSSTRSEL